MPAMSAAEMIALAREGMAEGLNLAAEHVRGVAVPKTPLEYGDLRSSLTVVPATEGELQSAVVSGLDYAVPVHENLTAYHDDGEAKYLENAAIESRGDIEQIVGTAVRRRLG